MIPSNKLVLVFKTAIQSKKEVRLVSQLLGKHFQILRFSFDLEDCDNILRIETKVNIAKEIEEMLNKNGIRCEELD